MPGDLLNILFGLDLEVVDGLGTACENPFAPDTQLSDKAVIDMAFARLGSALFIVLDTEGNNSAVEQQREAAHVDVRGCSRPSCARAFARVVLTTARRLWRGNSVKFRRGVR